MILRNIADGLMRRDWGTVLVELVLVIAGVVIALQVDNWNSERIARGEEADYLSRIISELEDTRSQNAERIARAGEVVQALARAQLALLDRTLDAESQSAFESDFEALDFFFGATTESSVVSEMISSGKVALVDDARIRAAITGYQNAIDVMKVSSTAHFEVFLRFRGRVHQVVRLRPGEGRSESIDDSIDELLANRELLGILSFAREFQGEQLGEIEEFQRATVEFQNLIQDYADGAGEQSP